MVLDILPVKLHLALLLFPAVSLVIASVYQSSVLWLCFKAFDAYCKNNNCPHAVLNIIFTIPELVWPSYGSHFQQLPTIHLFVFIEFYISAIIFSAAYFKPER
jgi:hypothetical protein